MFCCDNPNPADATYSYIKHLHHLISVLALSGQGVVGSVVDENGKALRDAKVTVFLPTGTSEVIHVSKNSGKFRHILTEGHHKIMASLEGYEKYKMNVHVEKDKMTEFKIVLESGAGVGKVVELTPASATTTHGNRNVNADYDYFYYPKKKLLDIKAKHSRHFDIYK